MQSQHCIKDKNARMRMASFQQTYTHTCEGLPGPNTLQGWYLWFKRVFIHPVKHCQISIRVHHLCSPTKSQQVIQKRIPHTPQSSSSPLEVLEEANHTRNQRLLTMPIIFLPLFEMLKAYNTGVIWEQAHVVTRRAHHQVLLTKKGTVSCWIYTTDNNMRVIF